jgi:hypothetical protein
VAIDDGHGGLASTNVTVTLIGADDAATANKGGGGGKKAGGADVAGDNSLGDAHAGILSNSDTVGISGDQVAAPATTDTTDTSLIITLGVADLLDHP